MSIDSSSSGTGDTNAADFVHLTNGKSVLDSEPLPPNREADFDEWAAWWIATGTDREAMRAELQSDYRDLPDVVSSNEDVESLREVVLKDVQIVAPVLEDGKNSAGQFRNELRVAVRSTIADGAARALHAIYTKFAQVVNPDLSSDDFKANVVETVVGMVGTSTEYRVYCVSEKAPGRADIRRALLTLLDEFLTGSTEPVSASHALLKPRKTA